MDQVLNRGDRRDGRQSFAMKLSGNDLESTLTAGF